MPIKIGRIPDLHSEPFYIDMGRRGMELCSLPSSQLGSAAEQGEIDAGPLPLVDCFRLEDRFQPVGGFCIATTEESGADFLYSKVPIEELGGAQIGILAEAATTPELLQVILRLKYQLDPVEQVSLDEPHDAFLLSGNRALRQRTGPPPQLRPHRIQHPIARIKLMQSMRVVPISEVCQHRHIPGRRGVSQATSDVSPAISVLPCHFVTAL